jgi:hypothetical protein
MPLFPTIQNSVNIATVVFGLFGIVQAVAKFPRYWRYRRIRRLLRLRRGRRTVVVCSELDQPEKRQWVEPHEFIYMLKYGDIDALFEIVTTVRTVYPEIRLEVLSAQEAAHGNIDYDCDIIVVGGPDYNVVAERIIEEGKGLVTYSYEQEESAPAKGDDPPIVLCAEGCQPWKGQNRNEDFGYIEVMENPFCHRGRLIMFGGCHTIGVTAAVRVLQLRRDGAGLTNQAKKNLRILNRHARFRSRYGAIFRGTLVGATIPSPNISQAYFFGDDRKFLGVTLRWFGAPPWGPHSNDEADQVSAARVTSSESDVA